MFTCMYGAYLISGSFGTEVYILGYIYGSIYPIILNLYFCSCTYIMLGWAEMNSLQVH
jgi:hypothetical protein